MKVAINPGPVKLGDGWTYIGPVPVAVRDALRACADAKGKRMHVALQEAIVLYVERHGLGRVVLVIDGEEDSG